MEKPDAIVVGAGPSGSASAITMAREGLDVVLLDKGLRPGAKNMFGGILYTQVLAELVQDFLEEAPLERRIVSRRYKILSEDSELSIDFRTSKWQNEHNHMFTAFRGQFDEWFAKKAEEAGATLIPQTVVRNLIYEKGQFVGVSTSRRGDVRADIIVLAEGANSVLAEKSELKSDPDPSQYVGSVKEVLSLPRGTIDDRFNLTKDEGASIQYFGGLGGIVGSGYVYTFKHRISVGVAYSIEDAIDMEANPADLLEKFKRHPAVRPLVRGGEIEEYNAHMIPEGGIEITEKTALATDGLLVVGDAAGFVNMNPLYLEGTNLAMESGRLAGETAVLAHENGNFSAAFLSQYEDKLRNSWLWEDVRENSKVSKFVRENKHIIREKPDELLEGIHELFRISKESKTLNESRAVKKIADIVYEPGDISRIVNTFSDRPVKETILNELRSKLDL